MGGLMVLLGAGLLLTGLFSDLTWLNDLGFNSFAARHPAYVRHVSFIKPLLVLTGGFLLVMLLLRKRVSALGGLCQENPARVLSFLLLLFLALYGFVSYFPFHNYPFCMDEYNYLYQAQIFAKGSLYLDVPEKFAPFRERYVILENGRLFSKYPPGFPVLLSFGVLLQLPGLINPLVAVATLLVLYCFVTTFFERIYGLLAVVLMATTPYFLAYSASYFSQPAALLLSSLTFFLIRKYELTSRALFLHLAALTAGYAALTRPLDCFCLIVPAGIYLMYVLYEKGQFRKVGYPLVIFGIVLLFFLTYNFILTERVSIATYPIVKGEFKVVDSGAAGFFDNLTRILNFYFGNALDSIPDLLGQFFFIPTALFIPIFALFGFVRWQSRWKWVLLVNLLLLILLYNFHPGTGWPQYGARYYYSGFFSVVVVATMALRGLIQRLRDRNMVVCLLILIFSTHIAFSSTAIWQYSHRFNIVSDVWADIASSCQEQDSIVILNKRAFKKFMHRRGSSKLEGVEFIGLSDFRRNPFMDTSRLIMKNSSRLDLGNLRARFPDHSLCFYDYNVLRK